jgi:glucose/mannose-6-phosphate isomerase
LRVDEIIDYEGFDAQGMLQNIRELPKQVQDAWEVAAEAPLPGEYREVQRIVVAGMGGSAIGASLLGGLLGRAGRVPLEVVRGYDLPPYVEGDGTLVVASSYSGNTEETLSAFEEARSRGVRLLAITTGGELARLAEGEDVPVWRFAYPSTPRAALGYSFTLLLALAHRLGVLPDVEAGVEEAVDELRGLQPAILPQVPDEDNPAKRTASLLRGKLPVMVAGGFLVPVARRWKGQFNENAKQWAAYDTMPELNHNAVVGFGEPEVVNPNLAVVFLRSNLDHPRVQVRWEVTKELLMKANTLLEEVYGRGEGAIAQVLTLIHFGDFVSYYLAGLNGVDPSEMENIVYLKKRLAKVE